LRKRSGRSYSQGVNIRELVGLRLVFCALAAAALGSCSGHPPEILRAEFRPVFVRNPAGGALVRCAAIFAQVEEPDGWEDLEIMYIIHDGERLYWSLAGRDLELKKKGNELWIGSSGLVMPDRRPFPGGVYRLQVRDYSGRRHEAVVNHSPPSAEPAPRDFPSVRPIAGTSLTWIFYAADGRVAGELAPRPGAAGAPQPAQPQPPARPGAAAGAAPPAGSENFFVYSYDSMRRIGLAVGPYALSEYAPADGQK
jgi:hypothetical protein